MDHHEQHQTQMAQSSTMNDSSVNESIRSASVGDIVTIDLSLTPENGMELERHFDTHGKVSFVLGGGNYLPGLHELVEGMNVGDEVRDVSIDGGWGRHNPDLVIEVPKNTLKKMRNVDSIAVGSTLHLKGNIQVSVLKVTNDTITVDANHPLAGAGYTCDLKVLAIHPYPVNKLQYSDQPDDREESSHLEVATFAMGCYWGGELAFMRLPGVVGTKVGYTQGIKVDPYYEDVCKGGTKHREAILVVYDSRVVSYRELVELFLERLAITQNQYAMTSMFHEDDADEESLQYQHGLYFHNMHQYEIGKEAIGENNKFGVELRAAAPFYDAQDSHQQYLLKGGQSARKGCKETIRCFG